MSQRPVGRSRIVRMPRTPDSPPTGHTAPSETPSGSPYVTWRDPAAPAPAETPASATAPTGGESLPDTSGGRVCRTCWAYAIDSDAHAGWHRKQDEKARAWDHIKALVLRVFLARGYITTDGDSAASGEDTPA